MKFFAFSRVSSLLLLFTFANKSCIFIDSLSYTSEFLKLTASEPKLLLFPFFVVVLTLLFSWSSDKGATQENWLKQLSSKCTDCTELYVINFWLLASGFTSKGKNSVLLSSTLDKELQISLTYLEVRGSLSHLFEGLLFRRPWFIS